jgi:putative transposase
MRNPLQRYYGRGDLHFITFSCYRRRPLLGTRRARERFVKVLEEVRLRHEFEIVGYVVMPEHVHLLISEPARVTPSKVLQVLKQKVSRALRRKPRRSAAGQLSLEFAEAGTDAAAFWQRRFYDFNVWSAKKVKEKLEYMHANPVMRKLATHPRDWPWSSWLYYAKGEEGLVRIGVPGGRKQRSTSIANLKKSQNPHP